MRDYDSTEHPLLNHDSEAVFNRIVSGRISSVDTKSGKVSIRFEDFVGFREDVDLSFDYFSSVNAACIRFMPSIGDKVICGFRMDNSLEILRYKPTSYEQLTQFAEDANPPFLFRELKSGEWEIASKGFASIYASVRGLLKLSGGLADIELDRDTNQITSNGVLHHTKSDVSEIRFGSQRRDTNPLSLREVTNTDLTGFHEKEFYMKLAKNFVAYTKNLAEVFIGNVADAAGTIFFNRFHPDTGQDLVADVKIYTDDGIQNVRLRTDKLGNTRVDLPLTAIDGFRFLCTTGKIITEALSTEIKSTTTTTIDSNIETIVKSSVKVTLQAPLVEVQGSTGNVLTTTTAFSDFTGLPILPGVPTFKSI